MKKPSTQRISPDDEQNPEDVKRWCQQSAPTEEQQQQDQNDQRNHS